jgi:hypothetical protein
MRPDLQDPRIFQLEVRSHLRVRVQCEDMQ